MLFLLSILKSFLSDTTSTKKCFKCSAFSAWTFRRITQLNRLRPYAKSSWMKLSHILEMFFQNTSTILSRIPVGARSEVDSADVTSIPCTYFHTFSFCIYLDAVFNLNAFPLEFVNLFFLLHHNFKINSFSPVQLQQRNTELNSKFENRLNSHSHC